MEYPYVIRNSGSLKFKDSSSNNGRESTLYYYTNRSITTQNSGRCHQSQGYDSFPNTLRKNYNENLQQQQFALASLANNPISADNVGKYQSNISPINKLVNEAEINPAKLFNQYGPHKQCSYNAQMKDPLNVDKLNPFRLKSLVGDAKLRETDSSRWDPSNRQSDRQSYVLLNKERKGSYKEDKFDRDRVNNLVDVSGMNCSKEFSNYVSKDNRLKDLISGNKFNHGCTDNLIDETGFSWTKRSSRHALNSRYNHDVPKDIHLKDPISVLKTKMVNMPTKTRFRQASLDEFIGDINTLPKVKTKKAKRKNSIQQSKENC